MGATLDINMEDINYRHLATQIGDLLKYDIVENEIDRFGQSILNVPKQSFPNDAITSVRAKAVYDWTLSLAKAQLEKTESIKRFINFCLELAPEKNKKRTIEILEKNGCPYNIIYKDSLNEFYNRNFHPSVVEHSQKLFVQGNYFHAVFESAKAYNKAVKEKSLSDSDGQKLMLNVWGCDNGVLKLTRCETQTDKDYQDGIKYMSSGLMSAIRNPTAHEPAIEWPIDKQDCVDILSLVSFLYRQLDKSAYYKK